MSHEDLASGRARDAKRRKVAFQAGLEDLEGRRLLSGVRGLPPRGAPAMVRHQGPGMASRQEAMAQRREAMLAARQQQAAARQAAREAMFARRGPRVVVNPTITVNPTISVGGPTSNPNANPTPTPTPTPQTQVPPSTPTPPAASRPPAASTPNPTPTPTNPARPTTPARPGNVSTWTDITRPGGANARPTTPPTPAQPAKPSTPAPTNPTPTPTQPTQPDPGPTNPSNPAPTFPDGTVLRDEQTGELGYYSQGRRGLISPPVAEKMGLTAEAAKAVSDADFQAVPRGPDYYPEGIFVRNDQNGEISRFSGGQFHVLSTPVATHLGIGVDSVATIPAAQYANTPKGNDYFPDGMMIQNQQTGEIDIYQGGERHWISVPVASRMNIPSSQIVVIAPSQFNGVPQGNDYFPDGSYLQNQSTGEIARYDGGRLRVVSAPVASKLGLTAADLISVSPGQYKAVAKGADYFQDGMFLKNNQTGELASYSGGQRHWISGPVAAAINLTDAMTTTIGADQFAAIPRGGDYSPPPPVATGGPAPTEQA